MMFCQLDDILVEINDLANNDLEKNSGQIIISHQLWFPWNKGDFPSKTLPFGGQKNMRGRELIWPTMFQAPNYSPSIAEESYYVEVKKPHSWHSTSKIPREVKKLFETHKSSGPPKTQHVGIWKTKT